MKKSLIALAVLAASGAAMAQSSVTLYGIADIWFGQTKQTLGAPVAVGETSVFGVDGPAAVGSQKQTVLDSGGVNTSRWGLKGSEDLGGGLKANFQLEQGFSIDNGAAKGNQFDRQAWVGVSGGFGEVRLGNATTAYDDVSGASNAVFDSALAPMGYVFLSTGYTSNPGDTVYYASPSFGGFAGAVSYSLGEDKTAALSASSTTSLNLTYGAGPLAVQFGYQDEDTQGTANDTKFTRLGASYNFGIATAKATYGKVSDVDNVAGFDATEYQIGVDVPLSAAMTLSASYASSEDDVVGFDQKRSGYGIAVAYTLSKRTMVYAGYNSNKATNDGAADDKLSIMAVGLNHKF